MGSALVTVPTNKENSNVNDHTTDATNHAIAKLLGEFGRVVNEAGRLANEGAARVSPRVAASSDADEIAAILTEAMAPAVQLLEQFERDHLQQPLDQR